MGGSMPRPASAGPRAAAQVDTDNLPDMIPFTISTTLPDATPHRLTAFQRFNELPFELRELIWIFSLPQPKLIEFHVSEVSDELYEDEADGWKHVVAAPSTQWIPAALHTCRQSRAAALLKGSLGMEITQEMAHRSHRPSLKRVNKPCKLIGQIVRQTAFRYWNPNQDAIFLKEVPCSQVCGSRSACHRFSTYAVTKMDSRLQCLVFSWSEMRYYLPLWLPSMPELKTILVLSRFWDRHYSNTPHSRRASRMLSTKTMDQLQRTNNRIQCHWRETLYEFAEELSLPALKNIKILAVEDERDALEEMELGFPGLRDGVQYEYYLPEGSNIPRKVRL